MSSSGNPHPDAEIITHLRDLWRLYSRDWTAAGFQALVVYRLARWRQTLPRTFPVGLFRGFLFYATRAMMVVIRNVYGIELHDTMRAGRRLKIGHQSGIVLHWDATFGEDCIVRQNVTLGAVGVGGADPGPVIGDRVDFGAGAVVLGGVQIGNDAKIGANAVVMADVPAGASAFGNPARIMAPKPPSLPTQA